MSPPAGGPPASHTVAVSGSICFRAARGPGLQKPGPSSVVMPRVVVCSSALLDLRLLESGSGVSTWDVQ